jgi:Carboxypeptidase regulatory-like domain
MVALSLPAWAGQHPVALSGYVRDVSGTPQMGAVVQIVNSAQHTLTVFTDGAGYYAATGLLPGIYSMKVTAPSFLPALLEKIGLRPGTTVRVNVTLNTLLDAMNVGPLRETSGEDDWKWTLRSVANRPVLRVLSPATLPEPQSHDLKAMFSLVAGSAADGYGSGSDMSTGFSLERGIYAADRVRLSGNLGYGDGVPGAFLRGVYSHTEPDGLGRSMSLTIRRFAPSDPNIHNASLQSVALNAGDDVAINKVVELEFGSELESIQFLGRVSAFRPYGSLSLHLSPNTILEYRYASTLPADSTGNIFDNTPSESSQSDPRVSLNNFATQLESGHHEELNISRRMGNNSLQLAAFNDRIDNTALLGVGEVTAAEGFLLPDVYSGTFTYTGDTLDAPGMRLVLERKFCSDLTATLDYAYGGALNLTKPDAELAQAQQWINTERRHAVAAKLSGHIPGTRTRWVASYRWVDGSALTPIDMFNASPGRADPYLNLVIHQPIPTLGFLPSHMEALIDLRNLLAQGYVPVMGPDGQTVYLVQAARSVRGGVAITF